VDSLITYLNMDGYAGFVWPSYGIAAVVMIGLYVYVRSGLRRDERTLSQLQAAGASRRRRGTETPDQGERDGDSAMDTRDGQRDGTGTGTLSTGSNSPMTEAVRDT
jgi:heme exporter protein D